MASGTGRGRLYVGTSGFAYEEWIGPFYPPGTKSAGMLSYYAGQFPSVEVNTTFRRLPAASTVARWAAQAPDGFAFACKAHQGITHYARLVGAEERLERFLEAVTPLGDRLGPILFQCPPTLRYDPDVLDAFLRSLPATSASGRPYRYAMEFRHPSFDTDEVRERLATSNVAWCVADTEEHGRAWGRGPTLRRSLGLGPQAGRRSRQNTAAGFTCTAGDFAYVRLRREKYDAEAISGWARVIGGALEEGIDVYAYLKHEDSAAGPRDAAALQALAAPD